MLPCLHQPKGAGNEKTQLQSVLGPACGLCSRSIPNKWSP